jgi:hypothetical protein
VKKSAPRLKSVPQRRPRAGAWARSGTNKRISPHPAPLPMGTLEFALRIVQGSLLQPHPLADAATLRRKLAKASLRGEGQDEGVRRLLCSRPCAKAGAHAKVLFLRLKWIHAFAGTTLRSALTRVFATEFAGETLKSTRTTGASLQDPPR